MRAARNLALKRQRKCKGVDILSQVPTLIVMGKVGRAEASPLNANEAVPNSGDHARNPKKEEGFRKRFCKLTRY